MRHQDRSRAGARPGRPARRGPRQATRGLLPVLVGVVCMVSGLPATSSATAPGHAPAERIGGRPTGHLGHAAATTVAVPRAIRRYDGRLPAGTRQLIVVSAATTSTSYGTVKRFALTARGWQRRNTWRARLGAGGLVKAARRVQGTNTTPMGKFTITEAFGRKPDPGTALPYRHVTNDDWWVQDRHSRYYNQRRLASQGGFRVTTYGRNGSEHLRAMGRQYDYVAVIDFNRPDPVVGRGSGIFLHVRNGNATAGCVSIPHRAMRKVLRWLDPAEEPVIVIGRRGWLRAAR